MSGPYLNDPGYEVPENTVVVVPHEPGTDGFHKDVLFPLKGDIKRDWFNSHFYYCLPINIGNQYGFVIKSARDLEAVWDGTLDNANDISINYLSNDNEEKQFFHGGFGNGVLTVQNCFALKTPQNINLMTIQPPNMFIPGTVAMTGVVETDQIRRDFTFNLKLTDPGRKVIIKKGDALGAFIPIPRYFVDSFDVKLISDIFDTELHENEIGDQIELSRQRAEEDKLRSHESGRKYFNGEHAFGEKYQDHQKRLT